VMAGMDFEKKEASLAEPFFTTDNEAADFEHIFRFYSSIQGKVPELGMSHLRNTTF